MRICIHRGTREIGGTCIEVESQGKRLVLDVGLPLETVDADAMALHPVPGFDRPDPSLLGVLLSHPHQDHYGLAYRLPEETTFLIGKAAERILAAAELFTPAGLKVKHVIRLDNRRQISLGPFTITPYLVDHSAYDSYAVLVEADGRRVFYSGDFRAHGRKAKLVQHLIDDPPKDVDVLLLEGTTLGRPESKDAFPTEDALVPRFVKLFEETEGLALVWVSGQNIDRIVTLYKACRTAERQFIIDVYTADILRATENTRVPQAHWREIRVFLPQSQRRQIKSKKRFDLTDALKPYRIHPNEIPDSAACSVMLFRPSMMRDLDKMEGLRIGRLIHSMWKEYLTPERSPLLLDWLEQRGIPVEYCHTSGHASKADLKRLRDAFSGSVVVPIHTTEADQFESEFGNARRAEDGEWWQVPLV